MEFPEVFKHRSQETKKFWMLITKHFQIVPLNVQGARCQSLTSVAYINPRNEFQDIIRRNWINLHESFHAKLTRSLKSINEKKEINET